MRLIKLALALGLLSGMASAVDATLYTATFSGTVVDDGTPGSGIDAQNLFGGGNLIGSLFTTVYYFDTSLGSQPFGIDPSQGLIIQGGTQFHASSPILSANLTIAGYTFTVVPNYLAGLTFLKTSIQSDLGFAVMDTDNNTYARLLSNGVEDRGEQPFGDPMNFYSGSLAGAATNTGQLKLATPLGTTEELSLSNSSVKIAAVPETSTWALMMIGFSAIGAAMRRRNRRTGAVASA